MRPLSLMPFIRGSKVSSDSAARGQQEPPGDVRYQALRDSDSTGVYTCDAAGVITYFNKQATELWGRTPALGDTDERFCGSHMMYRADGSYMPHAQCPMPDG